MGTTSASGGPDRANGEPAPPAGVERTREARPPLGGSSSVRVLPWWAYALGAFMVAALTGLAIRWLLTEAGGDAKLRIEAIRTGLTVGLGAGGAFALVINARRQWLQERAHNHQAQIDADNRAHQDRLHAHQAAVDAAAGRDAVERRITELYNAAAEQLSSDKAPVRLTALYTLERLANDNPDHRQTIVNIICAYLRMPFTPPATPDPQEEHRERARRNAARYRAVRDGQAIPIDPGGPAGADPHEEHQVRLTAQRLLHTHLQPDTDVPWHNISLDLTGAALTDFTLEDCHLNTVDLANATLTGTSWFERATFTGFARFDAATFSGPAWFDAATFSGNALFRRTVFSGHALFDGTIFSEPALFGGTVFSENAVFQASFCGRALFGGATFSKVAAFVGTNFADQIDLGSASFSQQGTELANVTVSDAGLAHEVPVGWRIEPTRDGGGRFVQAVTPPLAGPATP